MPPSVYRWVLDDGQGETYTFPKNPATMGAVHRERALTAQGTTAVDGRDLLFEGRAAPREWSFSGTTHDYAHYEALRHWVYDKVQRVWITDHFGRRLTVVLRSLNATPVTRLNKYWYHEYEVTGLLLEVGPASVMLNA
jgi:hypothetical protein